MCQTLMNNVLLLLTFHYISQTQEQNTGMKAASSRHGIEICGYTPFGMITLNVQQRYIHINKYLIIYIKNTVK